MQLYKQVYLISKDESNSWFRTAWISEKVAFIGKKIKITHDDKIWTILEVYPDTKTLDEVNHINNQDIRAAGQGSKYVPPGWTWNY